MSTDLVIVRCGRCGFGRVAVLDDDTTTDARASVGTLAFRSVQRNGATAPRARARHGVPPLTRARDRGTSVPFESIYTGPNIGTETGWTPTCQKCDASYSYDEVLTWVRWALRRSVRKATIPASCALAQTEPDTL